MLEKASKDLSTAKSLRQKNIPLRPTSCISKSSRVDINERSVKKMLKSGVSIEQLKRTKEFANQKQLLNRMSYSSSNVRPKKIKFEHNKFTHGLEFNLDRYVGLRY